MLMIEAALKTAVPVVATGAASERDLVPREINNLLIHQQIKIWQHPKEMVAGWKLWNHLINLRNYKCKLKGDVGQGVWYLLKISLTSKMPEVQYFLLCYDRTSSQSDTPLQSIAESDNSESE